MEMHCYELDGERCNITDDHGKCLVCGGHASRVVHWDDAE